MLAKERQQLERRVLVQTALWTLITGAILFGAAGTLRWPEAWVFLGIWIAGALVSGLALARNNPEIIKERMRSPLQKNQKRWDKPLLFAIFGGWAALQVVAGLDAKRFAWSNVPVALETAGAAAVVIGIYVFHIVMRENAYASAVVKIDAERGHKVISSGPYALVRHPMYAGTIFYFLGSGLLLGSWWALAVGLGLIAIIALRAKWEEQTLVSELPGYAAYAKRVRYRMVPGVW